MKKLLLAAADWLLQWLLVMKSKAKTLSLAHG